MDISLFGERFSATTGIQALMDDLGTALAGDEKTYMLGGGNPALIPEVSAIWRSRMREVLDSPDEFDRMLGHYDTPRGKREFLSCVADLLRQRFGWPLSERNVAVTNGSQNAFFLFLNMYSGRFRAGGSKKILFPLIPEYIGYADQAVDEESFVSRRPIVRETGAHEFKYFIDFDNLEIGEEIGALCVSRPTNPSGNVLTDAEIRRLSELTSARGIPLFVDNAYGTPFPHIVFEEVEPVWNESIVMSMSLSKIGLPSVRTGIVIASEEVIDAVSAANAVMNLATGGIGQVLTAPLIRSGEILRISRELVMPFYLRKSRQALEWIHQAFDASIDYSVHRSEGSLFLWIWFKNLTVTTKELYRRLKMRSVLIIPGEYFFYGMASSWDHSEQCIRLSYAQPDDIVKKGIDIIADEAKRLTR